MDIDDQEPGSPVSDDYSDSPPFERDDIPASPPLSQEPLGPSFSQVSSGFRDIPSGSGGKRRLPGGGSFGPGSSARDPKSRRRDEAPSRRSGLTNTTSWQSSETPGVRAQRNEELLDHQQVERLRAAWGDPFDESNMKAFS